MTIKNISEYVYQHLPKSMLPFDLYQRYRFTSEIVVSTSGKSVLEVGAGEGIIRPFLNGADYAVLTIDLNQGDVKGSGVNLPFRDNFFDAMATINALEHIPTRYSPGVVQFTIYHETAQFADSLMPFQFQHSLFCLSVLFGEKKQYSQ